MGKFKAEADAVDEASLLVEATEAAGGVDDLIFFLKGFSGHGLIEFIKRLLDIISISIAIQLGNWITVSSSLTVLLPLTQAQVHMLMVQCSTSISMWTDSFGHSLL